MKSKATNIFYCPICGKEYKHCPTCEKNGLYTWKNVACSIEHWYAHIFIEDYNNGTISKEKFVDDVTSAGILKDKSLLPEIKQFIQGIVDEIAPSKTEKQKTNK